MLEGVAARLNTEQSALVIRLVPVLGLTQAVPHLAGQPLLGEAAGLNHRPGPLSKWEYTK